MVKQLDKDMRAVEATIFVQMPRNDRGVAECGINCVHTKHGARET